MRCLSPIIVLPLLLNACAGKQEIKPVVHKLSKPMDEKVTNYPVNDSGKTRELTLLTVRDKKPEKDSKNLEKIRSANRKKYDIDSDRWGDGRKSKSINVGPTIPPKPKKNSIPIFSGSIDLEK